MVPMIIMIIMLGVKTLARRIDFVSLHYWHTHNVRRRQELLDLDLVGVAAGAPTFKSGAGTDRSVWSHSKDTLPKTTRLAGVARSQLSDGLGAPD
jgi:hypothetical protein